MQYTNLHKSLKLKELAMKVFKVLLEKIPEPIIKHDLHQDTERLLLGHLKKTKRFINQGLMPLHTLITRVSHEAK